MKKSLGWEISSARYPFTQTSCCGPDSPCGRCSIIRLTSHRFAIFLKKFGRLPGVNDELFFDETLTQPVRASQGEIRNQILAAAQAQGLNFPMLLDYLGLNSAPETRLS
jgi:hypothetical protein